MSENEYLLLSDAKEGTTPRRNYKECILGKVVKVTSGNSCQLVAIFRRGGESRVRTMNIVLMSYSTEENMSDILRESDAAKKTLSAMVINKIVLVKIRGPARDQTWWATLYGLKDSNKTDAECPNIKDMSRVRPNSAKKSDLVNVNRWLEQAFDQKNESSS